MYVFTFWVVKWGDFTKYDRKYDQASMLNHMIDYFLRLPALRFFKKKTRADVSRKTVLTKIGTRKNKTTGE